MLFKFGPEVPLLGISPVSDALMGRCSWDAPAVRQERDQILASDEQEFGKLYASWKKKALPIAKKAWNLVEQRERKLYGKRSYFALLDKHPDGLDDFPDVRADPEVFGLAKAGASAEEVDFMLKEIADSEHSGDDDDLVMDESNKEEDATSGMVGAENGGEVEERDEEDSGYEEDTTAGMVDAESGSELEEGDAESSQKGEESEGNDEEQQESQFL